MDATREEDCGGEEQRRAVETEKLLRGLRGSASSLVLASRRGSIVVSPTNGDLLKSPLKEKLMSKSLHVQFHNGGINGLDKPPPSLSSSSTSSLGQFSEARSPDGGWGWVVVLASFLVNLIADGITFSFGIIYKDLEQYYGEGKSKTAWIGSSFMAIPLLSGPIASFLTDRYGCKNCCVVGGILAASGFVISAFTTSLGELLLFIGILAGFGLSLCYVAAVVIVAYYFDSKRSLATGLSVCGSGIGTFVFAPVIQFLLTEYGLRGTCLILAGILLNQCVCGMLMRDLEWTKAKRRTRKKNKNKANTGSSIDTYSATSVQQQTPTSCPSVDELKRLLQKPGVQIPEENEEEAQKLWSSLVNLPTFVANGERVPLEVLEMLTTNKHLTAVLLHNYPSLLITSRSLSDSARIAEICSSEKKSDNSGKEQLSGKFLAETPQELTSPTENWWSKHGCQGKSMPTAAYLKDLRIHRHSLTYRGAMLNINRYRLRASSCPDIYRNSMTTIAKEKVEWYAELMYLLADMLDFSFFVHPRFLLFALSNFLLYTWYDVPYMYLADDAIKRGFGETGASIIISVIGIFNMGGEIILGWAGDFEWINANMVYALCMALCGAVVVLMPVISSYYALCTLAGAFGLFIAANYALTSIILVKLITLERFTNAYGLLLLVQGIANLVGPPLAGWLYDITGTYNLSFYLAGVFVAISGILLVVHPCFQLFQRLNKKHSQEKTANKGQQCIC